tara:strand:- start:3223 stop:4788 length:1566 start_codon:yes stop_codon:yes gene_type:complete
MKKIIDCTLRDGGYHTKWNFDQDFLDSYFKLLKNNPTLESEIGYKRHYLSVDDAALGKLAFCQNSFLSYVDSFNLKNKLWIMLDVKELKILEMDPSSYLDSLSIFSGSLSPVSAIRLAVKLSDLDYAIYLAKELNNRGYEVAVNIMSVFKHQPEAICESVEILSKIDLSRIYLADSEGIGNPILMLNLFESISSKVDRTIDIGFHSHNNNGMAMAWCLLPVSKLIDACDGSFLGFGRGAGNASTELLMAYFSELSAKQCSYIISFINDYIKPLQVKYEWGTSLATIIGSKLKLNQNQLLQFVEPRQFNIEQKISAMYKYNSLNIEKISSDEKNIISKNLVQVANKSVLIVASGMTMQNCSFADSINLYIEKYNPVIIEINVVTSLENNIYRITCVNSLERLCQVLSRLRSEPSQYITSDKKIYSVLLEKNKDSKVCFIDEKTLNNELSSDQIRHSVCVAMAYSSLNGAKDIWLAGVDGEESLVSRFSLVQRAIDTISKNIPIYSLTPTRHFLPLKLVHSIV